MYVIHAAELIGNYFADRVIYYVSVMRHYFEIYVPTYNALVIV